MCINHSVLLFTWPPGLFWHSVSLSPGETNPETFLLIATEDLLISHVISLYNSSGYFPLNYHSHNN